MNDAFSLSRLCTRTQILWTAVGIAALLCVVYGITFHSDFVLWDDTTLITSNPDIRGFSLRNLHAVFSAFDPELYIPVTFLTYQFDYALAGLQPWIYHATNLIFHILNSLLVVWLFLLLTGKRNLALLGGLLFALHPLNVEAVAWVSGRKDLVSGFFFLCSVIGYIRYRQSDRTSWYYVSVTAFLLGLLSKVSIVLLPIALLLIDVLEHRRFDRQMLIEKIPYFLLSLGFGLIAILGKQDTVGILSPLSLLLLAGKSTVFYLEKLVWPQGLSVLYPYADSVQPFSADIILSWIILIILAGLVLWSLRYTRVVFFAAAFYLLMLIPSFSNAAKGGAVYFASDRYAYLGAIGVFFLAILAWQYVWERANSRQQSVIAGITIVVLLLFSAATALQAATWQGTFSLFKQTISVYPDAYAAHLNLAAAYREIGDNKDAKEELAAVLKIKEIPKAYSSLGAIAMDEGDFEQAITLTKKAQRLQPGDAEAPYSLGVIYGKAGRPADAEQAYLQAIALYPDHSGARNNLAALYLQEGKLDEAKQQYQAILAFDPSFSIGWFNLGVVQEDQGMIADAISSYEHAFALEKPQMDLLGHLGPLYVQANRPQDAVRIFRLGIKTDPTDAQFLQSVLTGLRSILERDTNQTDARQLLQELLDQGLIKSH